MNEPLFVFLYFLIPFVAYRLLRAAHIDLLQISIPSVFFGYYFLIAYMGILPTYYGLNHYKFSYDAVSDHALLFRVFFYSGSCFLLMALGTFFTSRLRGSRRAALWARPEPLRPAVLWMLVCLVAVCAAVTVFFIKKFSDSALNMALSGDAVAARALRSEMTNALQGGGWYSAFYGSLLHFCTFVALSQALVSRKLGVWFLALGSFVIALYAALASGEKAPLIWLLMGCFLIYVCTIQRRIKLRNIFLFILITCGGVAAVVLIFVGAEGHALGELLWWAFSRTFMGALVPGLYYLKMFPTYHDFLWGRSLPNPHGIFPWEYFRISVEVHDFMMGNVTMANETVGSAPTTYWGELYANFGPIGPLIAAPIIGVYVYVIHILSGLLRPTPIKAALIVWCALHFMKLAGSNISDYLLDTDFFMILASASALLLANGDVRLTVRRPAGMPHHAAQT